MKLSIGTRIRYTGKKHRGIGSLRVPKGTEGVTIEAPAHQVNIPIDSYGQKALCWVQWSTGEPNPVWEKEIEVVEPLENEL